jgi:hypothetical protein
MKKTLPLLPILFLIYWGCEEEQPEEVDTTPPTVTITSPQGGSTVSVIVSISCISSDNEGVEKVELWVNGVPTDIVDNTEPYSLEWNTLTYDDGSYGITIRSYDTSGNTTDSEPITLVVYKTVELWGEFYSLENTIQLWLHENQLTGEIPSELWNLTNLTHLMLGNNQLTGAIPPEIGNLTNLTDLDLHNNELTGSIPTEIISELTNLTYLNLGNNQLTGSIPSEIGNLTNLTHVMLGENELTGSIPPEIGNLFNLTWLDLSRNQLTGEIPESLCNLVENPSFDVFIGYNKLCPPYPSCIEDKVGTQDTSDCP